MMQQKRILYIGQYSAGTTSKMRADALRKILSPDKFEIINTHIPFYQCHPIWRSLAFRFKIGKVIQRINQYILNQLSGTYDAIWVDKAAFIQPKLTQLLASKSKVLIHYTPDTAFFENTSKAFNKSLVYYDFAITTKSFEIEVYLNYISKERLLYMTQGYNKEVHYPRNTFIEKSSEVLFIGLFEPSRGKVVDALLENNITVNLAGKKWNSFITKHKHTPNFTFLGESLFGDAYAKAISNAKLALGLLSKRFPELHTTRTFEIPACGTALVTEHNAETAQFYNTDEVIFFKDDKDMVQKILYYLEHAQALEQLTRKGFDKVVASGFDYEQQLRNIAQITGMLTQHKS
jgi:spore maturation protein CgeB